MSPRRAPGGPRSGPRTPKSRPERAKRRPRPPRSTPGEDPRGPKPPRRLQGGLREPILVSSWGPRGSFSSLLGVLFEARARSARQTKTLFEIIGQKVFLDRCGPDVQRPLSTKLLN